MSTKLDLVEKELFRAVGNCYEQHLDRINASAIDRRSAENMFRAGILHALANGTSDASKDDGTIVRELNEALKEPVKQAFAVYLWNSSMPNAATNINSSAVPAMILEQGLVADMNLTMPEFLSKYIT